MKSHYSPEISNASRSVPRFTPGLLRVTFQACRLLIFVSPSELHNLTRKPLIFKIEYMYGSRSANDEVIDQCSREDRGFLFPIPLILSLKISSICDTTFKLLRSLFIRGIYLYLKICFVNNHHRALLKNDDIRYPSVISIHQHQSDSLLSLCVAAADSSYDTLRKVWRDHDFFFRKKWNFII